VSNQSRLAELLGWTFTTVDTTDTAGPHVAKRTTNFWIDPAGVYHRNDRKLRLPDPENNATDLEDLIAHLMTRGWYVEVGFQSYPKPRDHLAAFGVFLHIWHVDTEQHERIDCDFCSWKRSLCKLAIRVHDGESHG